MPMGAGRHAGRGHPTPARLLTVAFVAAVAITACAGLQMTHRHSREAFVDIGRAELRVLSVAPELPLPHALVRTRDMRMPSTPAPTAPVVQTPDAATVAVPAANAMVGPIAMRSDAVGDATAVPPRTAMLRRSPLRARSLAGSVPGRPAIGVIAALAATSFLLHVFLQRRSRRRRHMSTRKSGAIPDAHDLPKVETIAMSEVWVTPVPPTSPPIPPSATPTGVGEFPRSVTVGPGYDTGLLYLSAEPARSIEGDSILAEREDMPSVESNYVPRPVEAPVIAIASAEPICVFAAAHVAVEPASAKLDRAAMHEAALQAPTEALARSPQPEIPAPVQAEPVQAPAVQASPVQAPPLIPWSAARQMLDSGEYRDALDCLSGAMTDPQAPVGVWVMAARAWWCIAQGDGDRRAYENAAQAMERILEQEPDNDDVWSRMGTCRVLQAAGERGASRLVTLDIAIANLRRAVEIEAAPDETLLDTLGYALLQRAQATGSRAAVADLLEEAVSTLHSARRAANDASSSSAWLLQQALHARAATLPRADAAKLRMEIDALLRAGQHAASDEGRARWYVARVENELAHAELAQGATRALHLRALRAAHHLLLTGPDASPSYLLCWLRIVSAEIAYVRGEAVAARFDEGMAIVRRLEATRPGDPDIAHARARLLRRRAAHATGNARLSMLRDALQGLMPFVDRDDTSALQLEIAELMLEQAVASPSEQVSTSLARVIDVATPLLDVAEQAIPALCCIVQAQLARGVQADPELCERLCTMAPHDPRACAVLARAALRDGKPEQACGYCESAVRYNDGRAEPALLQLWRQASQQWNESLPASGGRRDWQVNHQHLRAAG